MKLLNKNGYKFATGMFWQIPDENKRSIKLSKLTKDTKHDMYCQVKNIRHTWGFCQKSDLNGEKKVASLGKFIIESSNLTADYANSIICYKFKNIDEYDDSGELLTASLYGYIVILNGTICPDDGEYVSEFAPIKESIFQKAKRYEIEVLYLPLDVAQDFFNIYELLTDAYHNDNLLIKILENINHKHKTELAAFINTHFSHSEYSSINFIDVNGSIPIIKKLIKEKEFEFELKESKDLNLRYLIPNIYVLAYSSDEIYWNDSKKFKQHFTKSLIQPINRIKTDRVKALVMLFILGFFGYYGYTYILDKRNLVVSNQIATKSTMLVAITPESLIKFCFIPNNKYFANQTNWILTNIHCDSLSYKLTFNSDIEATLDQFIQFTGSKSGSSLNGKTGILTKHLLLREGKLNSINKEQIITNLQQATINYKLDLTLQNSAHQLNQPIKFTINSTLSPIFLFKHGVLEYTLLTQINGSFNQSTGFYNWTIQGEI